MKKLALLVSGLILVGCGQQANDDITTVTVGVVGAFHRQWDKVNELLLPDNIQVELVHFTDFTTPNLALNDGDIDMNAFQNIGFLNNAIEQNGFDITIMGYTNIYILALYPNLARVSSMDDIVDGSVIGIPSDLTNRGRALKLLEAAGLIVIDPAAGFLPSQLDITEFIVEIEILEAESGMLASLLPDLDGAVINAGNSFVAGLFPFEDGIFLEDSENIEIRDQLINVIAARTADADNPIFRRIVEVYHTDEVRQTILTEFQGSLIPAW